MQQPTGQPNWPTPQPTPPPRHRRSWPRRLAILVCAAVGWFLGATPAPCSAGSDIHVGTGLMLVGMWVGLALGIWFGVWVTRPQARRPIDTERRPNQIFRRV